MEEENIQVVTNSAPPAILAKQAKYNRFGRIFYNLALTSLTLDLIALLSMVLGPIMLLFAIVVLFLAVAAMVVFTFGTVLLNPGNPASRLWSLLGSIMDSADGINTFVGFCVEMTKWISILGLVASICSIVFISLNNSKGKTGKLVFLIINIVVLAIVLILHLASGGQLWQN